MDPVLADTTRSTRARLLECAERVKGRTAICELLDLSDRIRDMISSGDNSEVKSCARGGMRFLRESAVEKVLSGLSTLREINKVTFVE